MIRQQSKAVLHPARSFSGITRKRVEILGDGIHGSRLSETLNAEGNEKNGWKCAEIYRSVECSNFKASYCQISSPHHISRIRLIKFDPNDTVSRYEQDYRDRLERIQLFNHEFWKANNEIFVGKIIDLRNRMKDLELREPSNEEMAVLFRDYLQKSRENHSKYHRIWIRESFHLLYAALAATTAKAIISTANFLNRVSCSILNKLR